MLNIKLKEIIDTDKFGVQQIYSRLYDKTTYWEDLIVLDDIRTSSELLAQIEDKISNNLFQYTNNVLNDIKGIIEQIIRKEHAAKSSNGDSNLIKTDIQILIWTEARKFRIIVHLIYSVLISLRRRLVIEEVEKKVNELESYIDIANDVLIEDKVDHDTKKKSFIINNDTEFFNIDKEKLSDKDNISKDDFIRIRLKDKKQKDLDTLMALLADESILYPPQVGPRGYFRNIIQKLQIPANLRNDRIGALTGNPNDDATELVIYLDKYNLIHNLVEILREKDIDRHSTLFERLNTYKYND